MTLRGEIQGNTIATYALPFRYNFLNQVHLSKDFCTNIFFILDELLL